MPRQKFSSSLTSRELGVPESRDVAPPACFVVRSGSSSAIEDWMSVDLLASRKLGWGVAQRLGSAPATVRRHQAAESGLVAPGWRREFRLVTGLSASPSESKSTDWLEGFGDESTSASLLRRRKRQRRASGRERKAEQRGIGGSRKQSDEPRLSGETWFDWSLDACFAIIAHSSAGTTANLHSWVPDAASPKRFTRGIASSSSMASISERACRLLVRRADSMPFCNMARASSVASRPIQDLGRHEVAVGVVRMSGQQLLEFRQCRLGVASAGKLQAQRVASEGVIRIARSGSPAAPPHDSRLP